MKKRILTLFATSVLVGSILMGCGSTAQQVQPSGAQSFSSSEEKTAGSTVSYAIPNSWESSAVDGGENYTHDGAVIGVSATSGTVKYAEDDMNSFVTSFGSSFTDFKVKKSELTKLAGKNAYHFTSTCNLSGGTVSMDTYVLILDSGTVSFTYGAANGNTSYASVFQSVLKSITITSSSSGGIQLKKTIAKEGNKSSVSDTKQFQATVGKRLTETMKLVKKLKYKAMYKAQGVDFTDFIDSVKDDYYTKKVTVNEEKNTVTIDMTDKAAVKADDIKKKLEKNFPEADAWTAANREFKKRYGSDSKIKTLTGTIDASPNNAHSWHLKAECEVSGADKIVELDIKGNIDNYTVSNLNIY